MSTPPKKEFTGQLITLNRPALFAPKLPTGQFRPSLTAKLVYDNPRLVVKTGIEADRDLPGRGEILAPMSADCWRFINDHILPKVKDLPPGKQYEVQNKTPAKNEKQENDMRLPPVLVSTTIIGRDKDGLYFVAIKSEDESRPRIKFSTAPSHFHPIIGPDGEFDASMLSYLGLRAFFKKIDDVFGPKLNEVWEPDASLAGTSWKDRPKTGGVPRVSAPPPAGMEEANFQDVTF